VKIPTKTQKESIGNSLEIQKVEKFLKILMFLIGLSDERAYMFETPQ
jgi:hypothetical protein